MTLDEEAAGPDRGVVNLLARTRFDKLHQKAHHLAGRVKLAALLAGAVGKILNQVFVCGAKQIGKLEVVVYKDKLRLIEMVEQILPFLVWDFGFSFDRIEI